LECSTGKEDSQGVSDDCHHPPASLAVQLMPEWNTRWHDKTLVVCLQAGPEDEIILIGRAANNTFTQNALTEK